MNDKEELFNDEVDIFMEIISDPHCWEKDYSEEIESIKKSIIGNEKQFIQELFDRFK